MRAGGAGDFAGDEGFAAARAFVVEQDAVAGEHVVAFAVIDGLPIAVDLRAGVGAAGIKRRGFGLRSLHDLAVHLAAGRLVKADRQAGVADGFEKAHRAQRVDGDGINGLVEADAHVRLGAQVVHFVRLDAGEDFAQAGAVDQIAVMQEKTGLRIVGIAIEMADAVGVE